MLYIERKYMLATPVSVIIPAYNEEEGLGNVIERVKNTLGLVCPFEIIVVNDGSNDKTGEIACSHSVSLIENPANIGYGFSLKRGIRAATHECVVITDADGTYPIEKLPEFIDKFNQGFDMVVGARQGSVYMSSVVKRFARACFKIMSEFVVGKRIPDINSGFRVLRKSKMLPILDDLSNTFSFTTSTTLIFFLRHYFIAYIPIEYHKRAGSSKVHYVRDALIASQIMAEIISRYNPIKMFLLLSLPAAILMIIFLLLSIFGDSYNYSLAALMSFYFWLLFMGMGFLGTLFRK